MEITVMFKELHKKLPEGIVLSWAGIDDGPWHCVLTNPADHGHWYIANVETGQLVRIGRVGAKRTNYRDVAIQEAFNRNRRVKNDKLSILCM